MVLLQRAAVLLALGATALSFPTWSSTSSSSQSDVYTKAVVESLSSPPRGWVQDDTHVVDKDAATIRLRMHLVHQDMDKFYETALNIATPGHSSYGGHMSQKAIDGIIAPKDESGSMVMEWLENEGLASFAKYSNRGDSVIVEASVAQIQTLLNAEYSAFCEYSPGSVVKVVA